VPRSIAFRIVLWLAWANLAVLAADAVYNIVKAVVNQYTGFTYF
jgi:hypothetical protein